MRKREKIIFLNLLIFFCLSLFSFSAQAAVQDDLVNYWYQTMVIQERMDDFQPSMEQIKESDWDKLIADCEKLKNELQAVKLASSLESDLAVSHQQKVQCADLSLNLLKEMKQISQERNPLLLLDILTKAQKLTQLSTESNKQLILVCNKYLASQKNLSAKQAFPLYWATVTEKELRLSGMVDDIMQSLTKLMKMGTEKKVNEEEQKQVVTNMLENMSRQLKSLKEEVKKVPIPTVLIKDVTPLQQSRLKILDKTAKMIDSLNLLLVRKETSQSSQLMQQIKEIKEENRKYDKNLLQLIEKYNR